MHVAIRITGQHLYQVPPGTFFGGASVEDPSTPTPETHLVCRCEESKSGNPRENPSSHYGLQKLYCVRVFHAFLVFPAPCTSGATRVRADASQESCKHAESHLPFSQTVSTRRRFNPMVYRNYFFCTCARMFHVKN